MGFIRKISDSDLKGDEHLSNPSAATIATTTLDSGPKNKKRKRDKHVQIHPFHEISDDSDSTSDEEKSPKLLPGGLKLTYKSQRQDKKSQRRVIFGDTRFYDATLTKAQLREVKGDLWFTKQDRLRSQAECLEVLKSFRVQNAEEVTQFSTVYRTSMQVPFSQESSDYLERATISVPLTIRGMEWGIAPKLKKRRKEHIQNVLTLQENIRDVELRERFVSSRSLQSSRPARIMARMIGEGDASDSKLGTSSTALNVRTVPMAKTTKKKPKVPLQEQRQHNLPRKKASNASSKTSGVSCGLAITKCSTKATKMGHARRRRRPVLWRKVL